MTIMTALLTNARDVARHTVPSFPTFAPTSAMAYLDPLDEDEPSDDVVVTTRRAISRVL